MRARIVQAGTVVRIRTAAAVAAVVGLVAFYAGFEYGQPKDRAPQVYAQPARAIPGGKRLAVDPKPLEAVKPRQTLEKGEKVLAVGKVTVRPRQRTPNPLADASTPPVCSCDPVTLDFTATRDRAGQPGVLVTSDNGHVLDGSFTPLFQFKEPARLPAVLAAGTNGRGASILYGRDLGPFWAAGQATFEPQVGVGGYVHLGIRLR